MIHHSHVKCDDCGERHNPGAQGECVEILKARAETAEALNHEWNVYATHAGMAGYEFIDDPKRVFARVREIQDGHFDAVKARKRAEAELARLSAPAREQARETVSE